MRKLLGICLLLLCGCTVRYESERSSEVIENLTSTDLLTAEECREAVDELELMLVEVCNMADTLVKRGVRPTDVRDSLRLNRRYMTLVAQAYTLDSIVLGYMERDASLEIRRRYNHVLRRYGKRARSVGLN